MDRSDATNPCATRTPDFILRPSRASSHVDNFEERQTLIEPANEIIKGGGFCNDPASGAEITECLHIKVDLGHYFRIVDAGEIGRHVGLHRRPELLGCVASTLFSLLQEIILENYSVSVQEHGNEGLSILITQ